MNSTFAAVLDVGCGNGKYLNSLNTNEKKCSQQKKETLSPKTKQKHGKTFISLAKTSDKEGEEEKEKDKEEKEKEEEKEDEEKKEKEVVVEEEREKDYEKDDTNINNEVKEKMTEEKIERKKVENQREIGKTSDFGLFSVGIDRCHRFLDSPRKAGKEVLHIKSVKSRQRGYL